MTKPSLSLIVPAYNEATTIREAIEVNLKSLRGADINFELIVIDDGSQDGTRKVIQENFAALPPVKFLAKPNGGIGSAIKRGISIAAKDYVTFAPVDSPLTPDVLDLILANLGKADILVAYRLERKGYSWRMRLNSGIYHFLISVLFGMRLKDYNWIHVYPRNIFDNLQIENDRIFMLAEALIRARRLGFTFYEFPVSMEARRGGKPTAGSLKAAWHTTMDMLRFYFENF